MPGVGGLWWNLGLNTVPLERDIKETDAKLTGWARRQQKMQQDLAGEGGGAGILGALRSGVQLYAISQIANAAKEVHRRFQDISKEIEQGLIQNSQVAAEKVAAIGKSLPFVGGVFEMGWDFGKWIVGHSAYEAAIRKTIEAKKLAYAERLKIIKAIEDEDKALRKLLDTTLSEWSALAAGQAKLEAARATTMGDAGLAARKTAEAKQIAAREEYLGKLAQLREREAEIRDNPRITAEQKAADIKLTQEQGKGAGRQYDLASVEIARERASATLDTAQASNELVASLEREAEVFGKTTRAATLYDMRMKVIAASADIAALRATQFGAGTESEREAARIAADDAEKARDRADENLKRAKELIANIEGQEKHREKINDLAAKAAILREKEITDAERLKQQFADIQEMWNEGIIGETDAEAYVKRILDAARTAEDEKRQSERREIGRGAVLAGPWQVLSAHSVQVETKATMKEIAVGVKGTNALLDRILVKLGLA